MNAKRLRIILAAFTILPALYVAGAAAAYPALESVHQGNELYAKGDYNEAINKYDESLIDKPEAVIPKFNKANSYYRLEDLSQALDLYREVAADSKDMKLVARSKYNTGNCYFQQGLKQKDSNLQKALEDMQTSISYWRQVLDLEPENERAAKNIEVARLMIKDIIDQINKQKEEQQNQPQDPNQPQQQQEQPQQDDQQQQDQADQQQQNQQDQQDQQQDEQDEQDFAPDATAQEILDREQEQKKDRQILQRGGWQKVDKDW